MYWCEIEKELVEEEGVDITSLWFSDLTTDEERKIMGIKTLAIDFDGTLCKQDSNEPVDGAVDAMESYVEEFDVQVLSGRSATAAGREGMRQWLEDNGFPVDRMGFPEHKPQVDVILDDRAVMFNGTWPSAEELKVLRPWWKKEEG